MVTQFGVNQIHLVHPGTESSDVEEEEDEELKDIRMKSTPMPPVSFSFFFTNYIPAADWQGNQIQSTVQLSTLIR